MKIGRTLVGQTGWLLGLAVGLLGSLEFEEAQAQTNAAPNILFLRLQFRQDGSVALIKSFARDGRLKPRPTESLPDSVQIELLAADGRSLWQGAVADPRVRVVEYEDPPHSGKLKRKQIPLREVEFTIRVPWLAEARRIEFHVLESPTAKDGHRRNLGGFALPIH